MNLRKEIKQINYEVSKDNYKYVEQTIETFVRKWLKQIEREVDEINIYRRGNRRIRRITPCIFKSLSERLFKNTPVSSIVGESGQLNKETFSSKAKEEST